MTKTRRAPRVAATLITAVLLAGALQVAPSAHADLVDAGMGPSSGGLSSDNVEHIRHIPLSVDGVGGRVVGNYFYTNDQHKIMIFSLEDPLNPVLTDFEPLPQEVLLSREDLDTNGEILIMPNTVTASLRIYDVEDKTNITLLADVPGANAHTHSCVLDCKYAYGSDGTIVDLRDPTKPKVLKQTWGKGMPAPSGHDVEEVARGMVLTATQPIMLLDARKDPARPKLLASGGNTDGRFIHTPRWPQNGTDKFLLMAGETNIKPQCNESSAAFMTWDASKWKKTGQFTMIDEYRSSNGMYADGNPPANLSCSTHWHEASPKFDNGGIVASAMFEHGTRFIDVSSKGQIKEIGWFLPHAGSTSAVYWVTDDIVYAVDYNRGIDILRFTGNQ